MKPILLTIALLFILNISANAQLKEAVKLATLSPTILVIQSDMESYKKNHYMVSTIGFLGSYMITNSIWKSAVIILAMGITKELVYDKMLGKGTPLWEDMKWNTLGTAQGVVFTVSLKF